MFSTNEVFSTVGIPVGCVSGHPFHYPIDFDNLVIVVMASIFGVLGPAPNNLVIPVAIVSTVDAGVPFSNLRGGVPMLAKHPWPERTFFGIVNAARVFALHAHGFNSVLVMTRQHRCS